MQKPLSAATLAKKYDRLVQLGLSEKKIALLKDYFCAFANLYGLLSLQTAWKILKEIEGPSFVRKMDFMSFADVAQRDDLPFYIFNANEVYSNGTADPEERQLVHKDLVTFGYAKFYRLYDLEKCTDYEIPFYVPDKETMLSFKEDPFYLTDQGRKFSDFICALRSSGIHKTESGETVKLTDINGLSIKGKTLKEIVRYTDSEQLDLEWFKGATMQKHIRKNAEKPASEKILRITKRIVHYAMKAGYCNPFKILPSHLDEDFGVLMTEQQVRTFLSLFQDLNNKSNHWCLCGWSPVSFREQVAKAAPNTAPAISFGPGLQQMFASGALDRAEIERRLKEMGVQIIPADKR